MGGECNYLLRVAGPDKRLQFVPDAEWKSQFMQVRREQPRLHGRVASLDVDMGGCRCRCHNDRCLGCYVALRQVPTAWFCSAANPANPRCRPPQSWTEAQCQRLLDDAERLLLEGAHRLRLPVQVGPAAGRWGPGTVPGRKGGRAAGLWREGRHGSCVCPPQLRHVALVLKRLPAPGRKVLRKERAVGVVPAAATIYEVLEELAITVQVRLGAGEAGL